jgi:hypothetical protein
MVINTPLDESRQIVHVTVCCHHGKYFLDGRVQIGLRSPCLVETSVELSRLDML